MLEETGILTCGKVRQVFDQTDIVTFFLRSLTNPLAHYFKN